MNNTNPLQEAANQLASRGRYGDTMMVHMNPIEVDALAKLSPTGQLTTNPHTGQPEAFLPLLFSMIAPSLIGAGTAAGLSSLAASAIGSGIGTIAEGGSLQEGLTAGLMSGVTGGLLKGVMPEGFDLLGKGATEAVPEAATQAVQNLPQAIPTVDMTQAGSSLLENMSGALAAQTGQFGADALTQAGSELAGGAAGEAAGGFGSRLMGGIESALGPEGLPDTIGSLGAGMVGEMYVPWDTPEALGEESEYQYEGPYMPTEQRRMISTGDPLQSAFEAEQQMLEGNVFPPGFNMRYGGLVKRLQKGGMAQTQEDIERMAAEQRVISDMNKEGASKRFRDYQPEYEGLPEEYTSKMNDSWFGKLRKFIPDPYQANEWLADKKGFPSISDIDADDLRQYKENRALEREMGGKLAGRRQEIIDRLNREPVIEETAMSPDQQFIEERERLKKRGRRKLMEPVRR